MDAADLDRIRDAERRAAQQARGNDELKLKIREIREILARFGIKEKSQGQYVMDYRTLVQTLGAEQAAELAAELEISWRPPATKRGRRPVNGEDANA